MEICYSFSKQVLEMEEVINTDEFGTLKVERLYCRSCFEKALQKGFEGYEPIECEVCGKTTVPVLNHLDEDIEEESYGTIVQNDANILISSADI